jgi:pyruvate kinase
MQEKNTNYQSKKSNLGFSSFSNNGKCPRSKWANLFSSGNHAFIIYINNISLFFVLLPLGVELLSISFIEKERKVRQTMNRMASTRGDDFHLASKNRRTNTLSPKCNRGGTASGKCVGYY